MQALNATFCTSPRFKNTTDVMYTTATFSDVAEHVKNFFMCFSTCYAIFFFQLYTQQISLTVNSFKYYCLNGRWYSS